MAFLQSVLHFFPAHLLDAHDATTQSENGERIDTELRQGVGLRQTTGASAIEKNALYDMEAIPGGCRWSFVLDLDTRRGGSFVETLVFHALHEWVQGRCWLGAAAARGTGWMHLEADSLRILRLPMSSEAVEAWPDSTIAAASPLDLFKRLSSVPQAVAGGVEELVTWAEAAIPTDEGRFHYLVLDFELQAGPRSDGYGWDDISVGGHISEILRPLQRNLLSPSGVDRETFQNAYLPDHPVVTTHWGQTEENQQPYAPGSGLRGALRHVVSAFWRGQGLPVNDPNDPRLQGALGETEDVGTAQDVLCEELAGDRVAELFGIAQNSGRILIRDSYLADQDGYTLAWFQHHAEDEFAGGVYGTSKFDRTSVLSGAFGGQMVIEAANWDDLVSFVKTLLPALRLAEFGYVPVGGGRRRGHGHLRWKFTRARHAVAGKPDEGDVTGFASVADALKALGLDFQSQTGKGDNEHERNQP